MFNDHEQKSACVTTRDLILGQLPNLGNPEAIEAALIMAIRSFEIVRNRDAEIHRLSTALEERKEVERAKGIVMRFLNLSEDEAYRRLRRFATDDNQRLIDVSRSIIAAAATLFQFGNTCSNSHPNGTEGAR